jgi:hypothetical protein
MDRWKKSFVERLSRAQSQWVARFEKALDEHLAPVLEEYTPFLTDNGFRVSMPLRESSRRSVKFELAENAYVLLVLRSTAVGEFELRRETFVPGAEPQLQRLTGRIGELNRHWFDEQIRTALDAFVDLLAGESPAPVEQLVSV